MKRNSFPLDLKVQLLTPTSVVCDEPTTCVIVFNAAIAGKEDIYVKLTSPLKQNVFVLCEHVNPSVITFQAPTNFPQSRAELSLHLGLAKTLLCELNDKLEFKSRIAYVNTMLENLVEPISFLSSVFGQTEKDLNAVDTKLESIFKKKLPECLETLKGVQFSIKKHSIDQIISLKYPTLLHFGARYNFVKLCAALVDCPGANEALRMCNCDGLTPSSIAEHFGNSNLAQNLEVNDDVYESMSSYVDEENESCSGGGEDGTYMDMSSTYVGEISENMILTESLNKCNLTNGEFKKGMLKKTLSADGYSQKHPSLPKQMSLPNRPNLRHHSSNIIDYLPGIKEPTLGQQLDDDYVDLLNNIGEGNNEGVYDTVPTYYKTENINNPECEIYDVPPSARAATAAAVDLYGVTQQQSVLVTENIQYTTGMNIPPRFPRPPRIPTSTPRCQTTTFDFINSTASILSPHASVPVENGIYDVPPIPNQYNQDVYDTIPARDNIYDVPPSIANNSVYDVPPPIMNNNDSAYDVPPSNCNDIYDVPSSLNNNCIYDVPPQTNLTYDVPPSITNIPQVYDVLPNHSNHQIYDTPPPISRSIYNTPPLKQSSSYMNSKMNTTARPIPKLPFQPHAINNGQYFNIPTSTGSNQSINNSPFTSTKTITGNTQPLNSSYSRLKSERHGKPMPTPPEMPSIGPPPPILPREKVVPTSKPKKPTPKPRK